MGGVPALHVQRLVGLRVSHALGLGEHALVRRILFLHLGEDVVTGAVQDPVDVRETVGDETLAQGLDDRDAAGDARLKKEMPPVPMRRRKYFRAVGTDQSFVGRDDTLAQPQRREGQFAGQPRAANQFAHNLNGGIRGDGQRVYRQTGGRNPDAARLAQFAHGHAVQFEPDPQPVF